MNPYLEPRFVGILCLRTGRLAAAEREISRFPAPFVVTPLHVLQLEHLFAYGQHQAPMRLPSQRGRAKWNHYFAEGIFTTENPDWESALRLAVAFNAKVKAPEETWLCYLHAALAASSEATDYLSFQPEYRRAAKAFGLRVLPESL